MKSLGIHHSSAIGTFSHHGKLLDNSVHDLLHIWILMWDLKEFTNGLRIQCHAWLQLLQLETGADKIHLQN